MNNIQHFNDLLDEKDILSLADDKAPFLQDWRGNYTGDAEAVLFPRNTEQVSAIMRRAYEQGIIIVPQGGNTGLVGGGIPDNTGRAFVLSLSRMNKVRSFQRLIARWWSRRAVFCRICINWPKSMIYISR